MAVETFVGAGFSYVLANAVQEDQASLVDVTLSDPGYTVDSQDEVVFVYQF